MHKVDVDSCYCSTGNVDNDEGIGGVICNGQFSWVAIGATIKIYSMKNGTKVATHTFDSHHSQR